MCLLLSSYQGNCKQEILYSDSNLPLFWIGLYFSEFRTEFLASSQISFTSNLPTKLYLHTEYDTAPSEGKWKQQPKCCDKNKDEEFLGWRIIIIYIIYSSLLLLLLSSRPCAHLSSHTVSYKTIAKSTKVLVNSSILWHSEFNL